MSVPGPFQGRARFAFDGQGSQFGNYLHFAERNGLQQIDKT
jgi:hypothetical protein